MNISINKTETTGNTEIHLEMHPPPNERTRLIRGSNISVRDRNDGEVNEEVFSLSAGYAFMKNKLSLLFQYIQHKYNQVYNWKTEV